MRRSSAAGERDRGIGDEPQQPLAQDEGGEEPDQTAEGRQAQAFRHQLTYQASATRPERQPHRHLAVPRGRACEQQVPEVCAGNQQHQARCSEKHEQRLPEIAAQGRCASGGLLQHQTLIEKALPQPGVRDRSVVGGETLCEDRVGVCLGALQCDARSKTTEHMEPHHFLDAARLIAQPVAAGQQRRLHGERHPDVRPLADGLPEERGRRHADHRDDTAPERDRSTEHIGTSHEPALPELVADDGIGRGAWRRLLPRIESLADDCRNAEGREVGGRHEANGDLFSLAVCDAGLGALQVALRCHHRRERAVLILQLAEFRVREERPFASLRTYRHAARFGVRQNDNLVRIPNGQRAHQHAAHEAEDRRVRANPEGQRQHGNDGEAGVRRKDTDGVSKVLCDHVLMLPEGGW